VTEPTHPNFAAFAEKLRARALALGIAPTPERVDDAIRERWALAVREMPFPLTPKGFRALSNAWTEPPKLTDALGLVLTWLMKPKDEQENGICLYGPPGTGKSFAAAFLCVVRYVLRNEGAAAPEWVQAFDLVQRVSFDRDVDLHARTMVIDDLGAKNVTDAQISALEHVLDARGRPGCVLVLTSNGQPKMISSMYRDRVASRMALFRGSAVLCSGDDLR
jgi:DNA replication protein DnaC